MGIFYFRNTFELDCRIFFYWSAIQLNNRKRTKNWIFKSPRSLFGYVKTMFSCWCYQPGQDDWFETITKWYIIAHCSPESNLVKLRPPEEPTTYSESSRHEDFKNDLEDAVTSCAMIWHTKDKYNDYFISFN